MDWMATALGLCMVSLKIFAVSDRLQSAHEWIGLFYNCGFTALWVSACNGGM